jgi:carbonic anhydrase
MLHKLIHRRRVLELCSLSTAGLFTATSLNWQARADDAVPPIDPDAALKRLLEGNQRFLKQQRTYSDQSFQRLQQVSQAQHPFAALLSCADSRVPPEVLFDEGIGDIFDIRIPGNIVTAETLGSLEYATEVLGSPLIVVMGHERCGAVKAAVANEELPGSISAFVKPILPALATMPQTGETQTGDAIDNAVIANVKYQIEQVKQRSALITRRITDGKLKLVSCRYDLDTGAVTVL